jgi:hypothetical protein
MNTKILAPALLALLFCSASATAAEGMVTISSPPDGATFGSGDRIVLTYDAIPGPNGDHLHLNVDGKRMDVIHRLKGTEEVDPLPAGKHHICLAINTSAHIPTGVEKCIDVTVK